MTISPEESQSLLAALEYLDKGDSRRFQDALFLGFGDRWTEIQASLIAHRQVVVRDARQLLFGLEETGRALAAQIRGVGTRRAG